MRIQIAVLATAMLGMMMMGAMSAHAARSPVQPASLADVVGNWGANQGCVGPGAFAYVRQGAKVQQVVRDGQREYRTPVRVEVKNGLVRVHMDEKTYTFRLPTPNRLEALKYTDTRTGLTADFSPRTWFRCS
jgi:hypothetical protein